MATLTFNTIDPVLVSNASPTTILSAVSLLELRALVAVNRTSSTVTLDVWIDADGTSSTDLELVINDFSLEAGDSIPLHKVLGAQVIESGGTIKAQASASNSITIQGSFIAIT